MNTKKIIAYLSILLALLVTLTGGFYYYQASQILRVTFCDVGQGDAILIQTPQRQNILIDGGPDNSVLNCLGKNLPFYDRQLSLVILTHPHADHTTGLIEVLNRYQVKQVLLTKTKYSDPIYNQLLSLIQQKNIPTVDPANQPNFNLSQNINLATLYPLTSLVDQTVDNINNTSIVNKLTYQNISFLFMGDLEVAAENVLILNQPNLKSDVLKVGHHGSTSSSAPEFLNLVKPRIAIISVGVKNTYSLPSLRTIRRLEKLGSQVIQTSLSGEITIQSDGQKFWLK
ncbi:MAG: MBL fold metallo-hydrolase [Patescibacteria group bacterium]